MSPISFYMKPLGRRSAGKPPAALDVAGGWRRAFRLCANLRPYLTMAFILVRDILLVLSERQPVDFHELSERCHISVKSLNSHLDV